MSDIHPVHAKRGTFSSFPFEFANSSIKLSKFHGPIQNSIIIN
jgi:hypothetical protein